MEFCQRGFCPDGVMSTGDFVLGGYVQSVLSVPHQKYKMFSMHFYFSIM